jgi:chitinase/chitin-binding protein
MLKRILRPVLVVMLMAVGLPLIVSSPAQAHGWITSPPSRQDHCANNRTSFDCGDIKYEPQSVEAPKGSMLCSGGSRFRILDSAGPWPVTNIGSSTTFRWRLTAAHRTSTWQYYVDGRLHRTFSQNNQQPPANVAHTVTGLPSGRHRILAVWNIADTAMAFYACVDVRVR